MQKPELKKENIQEVADKKFVHLYDIGYGEGQHYYSVSRRNANGILAPKTDAERHQALPDAVSCFLILRTPGSAPRLLMFREFRYPTGQFVLGIPSGLIDERDYDCADPIKASMIREIQEETGITVKDTDHIFTLNHLLYCSPGLTDECTAAVCAVIDLEDLSSLNTSGAEGTEVFNGFLLYTREEVLDILAKGEDTDGGYYPMVTYAAMLYFISDLWKAEIAER